MMVHAQRDAAQRMTNLHGGMTLPASNVSEASVKQAVMQLLYNHT
jgi:hypothetical protein